MTATWVRWRKARRFTSCSRRARSRPRWLVNTATAIATTTPACSGASADFARESHQLLFRIYADIADPDYCENATVEHTALDLTGTSAGGRRAARDFGISCCAGDDLEVDANRQEGFGVPQDLPPEVSGRVHSSQEDDR